MGTFDAGIGRVLVLGAAATLLSAAPVEGRQKGPERFAEGVLDTSADEYGPVFTADGNTVYFTIRRDRRGSEYLAVSRRSNGAWSAPEALPFSGRGYDKEPFLSPDGSKLFFASRRAVPGGAALDFELWVSDRTASGWGPPRHLAEVGSSAGDNYPSVAANGNLYFGTARLEGRGRIFRAAWNGTSYDKPELVVTEGDVPLAGADPYIDPQERFLIFSSTRAGGYGEGDLYLSVRSGSGWSTPTNLGPILNTADYEFTPFVSRDGAHLYFSRGWGEMWRISVDEVAPLKAVLRR